MPPGFGVWVSFLFSKIISVPSSQAPKFCGFLARNIFLIVALFINITRVPTSIVWPDLGRQFKVVFRRESLGQGVFLLYPGLLKQLLH